MSLTALVKEVGYGSGNVAALTDLVQRVEEGQETYTRRRKRSVFFFISFRAELITIPKTQFYSDQAF